MKLLMYGVNKDTVMKEDTDKYFLDKQNQKKQMLELSAFDGVEEIGVLSNDFRHEYYLYVDEGVFSHGEFLRFLAEETDKTLQEIILETYSKFNGDALRHLYEVATGFMGKELGSIRALASVEEAYQFSKEYNTMGPIITRMFQSALDLAYDVKLDETLNPLNQIDLSNYVYLLHEHLGTFARKNFMISGSDLAVYFLTKLLLKAGAQSVSIIQKEEAEAERQFNKIKVTLNEVQQTKVYPVTEKSLYYRLSKVDVGILDIEELNLFDESIIEEVKIIRQTKKIQYLLNTEDLNPEFVSELDSDLDIRLVDSKMDYSFTEDEMTSANVIFDERLTSAVKDFMDYLDDLQQNNVKEKLIL